MNDFAPVSILAFRSGRAEPMFALGIAERVRSDPACARMLSIPKNKDVYLSGDHAEDVYLVERGQIKLQMITFEGKCCVFDVHAEGDVFGELSLLGSQMRLETATAMRDSMVRKMPLRRLLNGSGIDGLMQPLLGHLASRLRDQQLLIMNLVVDDSEKRLGKTLLYMARRHGIRNGCGTRLTVQLSHQDLSEMIGTTRPRVSEFMHKLREAECVLTDADHRLIVDETKLDAYIMRTRGTKPS